MQGRGTGIPKIRHFMQKNGSPEPVFETDGNCGYFLTTLYPHPLAIREQLVAKEFTGEVQRLMGVVTGDMKRSEIQQALGLKHEDHFRDAYLKLAWEQ